MASPYGTLADGRTAHLFTLENDHGVTVRLTDFGATLVGVFTPDRTGRLADITAGYDTLDGWVGDTNYMGATVGRYGNRIANGQFTLDGVDYQLAINNGPNHLHGGIIGFNKKLWSAEPYESHDESGFVFIYTSPDNEEGYPGELATKITYALNNANELSIRYEATTDRPTIVNLVHHTYWNLTGEPSRTILDHELALHADRYVPTDETSIPKHGLHPVDDTPFDFRLPHRVGQRIGRDHEQLRYARGYDHSWAINGTPGEVRPAAELYDPVTGRVMQVETDQPAIQLYTGNFLDGTSVGKAGVAHQQRTALCLETQRFPDSPNQPELSNAVLRPGEIYTHRMVHRFSTK